MLCLMYINIIYFKINLFYLNNLNNLHEILHFILLIYHFLFLQKIRIYLMFNHIIKYMNLNQLIYHFLLMY